MFHSCRAIRPAILTLALFALAACSAESGAEDNAQTTGDVSNSFVTLYSMPRGADEPSIEPLEISAINCDTQEQRTRIDLADGGYIIVEPDRRTADPSWRISFSLQQVDTVDIYRRTVLQAQINDGPPLDEQTGSVQWRYPFQLYGDLAGHYGLELDIRC